MNKDIKNEFLETRKKIIEKDFCNMNNMQKKAIFNTNGPLLILAGAGSGKTTVLVNRIANLIKYGNAYKSDEISDNINQEEIENIIQTFKSGTDINESTKNKLGVNKVLPWNILAITFTNKAAKELKERLINMLGSVGNDVFASTFHSTCSKILRKDAERIGYTKSFTIYDTDDSKRVIKDCQKALNIDDKMLPCKSIMSAISQAKDNMINPIEFKNQYLNDYRMNKIALVYDMYQKKLKEANAMDFDDLLTNTVLLFKECPDVLEYYQNKFKYILVDEYQDTNHVQYLFIKLLADKNKNLCVVGDDDQSIYKFRGATIENILNFEKTYPHTKTIRLEQNYRSTQTILDAANAVIENNSNRKGKKLWTENNNGDKITIHTALDEHDEAKYICDNILDNVAKGRKYSDFAILYRMNSQSNTIEKALVKSGIPYRIIGGFRFYERKEIKDMIAYLSVINNPYDEVRLRRIINQPKRSIGDKTIATAINISINTNIPLIDVIRRADEFDELQRSSAKLKNFAELIDSLIALSNDGKTTLSEIYKEILDKTDYIAHISSEKEDVTNRIENINELSSNIIKYEQDNPDNPTLQGFLEEVSLMTDIDNYDEYADTVVLMTMHSAKGLEFPFIFLPGFEESIFPGIQSMYNPAEVEEERRLAYVGITRAKEKLYILNASSRMIFGSTSRNKLSRFAAEIPEELIDKTKTKSWEKPKEGFINSKSPNQIRQNSARSARLFGDFSFNNHEPQTVYSTGDIVKHKVFGTGKILSVTKMSNDHLLEISFDKAGMKKLMANFSKLQKC